MNSLRLLACPCFVAFFEQRREVLYTDLVARQSCLQPFDIISEWKKKPDKSRILCSCNIAVIFRILGCTSKLGE